MTKRLLFPALAAGLLILSLGSMNAHAGQIPLPTTLDQLLPAGNFVVLSAPPATEAETFSNFTYSTSPVGSPPTAANVTVAQFNLGNENGLAFSGAFFAPAGSIIDYKLSYVVTAPAGFVINDALLAAVYNIPGGTGVVSISEQLFNNVTGASIGALSIFSPTTTASLNFAGVTSILVQKDILLVGGTAGAGVSIIDQGFSSVPEPASMALLGIGLSGLLTFRRFFKRAASAA